MSSAVASQGAERPSVKINVTNAIFVRLLSVVTLIRTDTTLDQSQKAEKVWEEEVSVGSVFYTHSRTWVHFIMTSARGKELNYVVSVFIAGRKCVN